MQALGAGAEPGYASVVRRLLAIIGPGMLVAATGVGAGDLATASFTGARLGTSILWAAVVGAALKLVLNEGLARWQLATGQTFLEGAALRLGRWVIWALLPYLVLWSFFVGSALMSACGVTLHAMLPAFEDPNRGKLVFGALCSAIGLLLVWRGGFALFEKVMKVCIAAMFFTVVVTGVLLAPGVGPVMKGLFVPAIADIGTGGLTWTVALIGGVGGTMTLLCYGYWLREVGRTKPEDLTVSRLDLGLAYLMTAVFGVSMIIIGSQVKVEGDGARLLVSLADQLQGQLGSVGRWAFLVGAFGAVFSSLLGVWQAVPYLFADLWRLAAVRPGQEPVDTSARPYRLYLLALAVVPAMGLWVSFKEIQKLYAVIGAAFMPLLALALLVMNGRSSWIGARFRNSWLISALLCLTLAFFVWAALRKWIA